MGAGTVPTLTGTGTGSWRHNRVAGAGIEPASGGYAYHYNFHCPTVCGLDYAFIPPWRDVYRLVSTPSDLLSEKGLARCCLSLFTRGVRRIWQIILCAIAHAHARESLPRYLSSTPLIISIHIKLCWAIILYGTCVYCLYLYNSVVSYLYEKY